MKLVNLKVKGYKNFSDVEIDFSKSQGKTLIVGTNGSGKSNLLEILSAIFSACFHKDKNVEPEFEFELEYVIERDGVKIKVGSKSIKSPLNARLKNSSGVIEMEVLNADSDWTQVAQSDFEALLPEHVVAVYSGEEKRLWENYYFKSYDEYNKQYINNKAAQQNQKMVYLNKYYWNIIASILAIHDIEDYKNFLKSAIGLNNVIGIHCKFNVDALKGNKNAMAKAILSVLNPDQKDELDITLDTYEQVKGIFGFEGELFYNMIVLALYKDYKIITELTIKCDNGIEIRDLSEGEKKLLLIYGAIKLVLGENLYLFDEPDAHLHEGRKQEIFDLIQEDLSHFIITSHSPTLTNLFDAEKVVMLNNSGENTEIIYGHIANTISALTGGQWSYIEHTIFLDRKRPLLLVEGSGDVGYIKRSIELLAVNNPEYKSLKNMDIIHCGGASGIKDTLDELTPSLPNDKKIIALFDRDEAGGSGMCSIINIGRDRNDTVTYKRDNRYFLKLPKTEGHEYTDFVIEDYFKKDYKKSIAQTYLDNAGGVFNCLPKDLKDLVKKELSKNLASYNASDMEGFKVLLDKLLNIINGYEEVKTV